MQIVIDIDEDYVEIINKNGASNYTEEVIQNGTPLPKGHGKIGDLDALREEVSSWGMNDYEPSDFTDAIDQAPTIIEADKDCRECKVEHDCYECEKYEESEEKHE